MASKQMVLTPKAGGEQIVLDKAILLVGRGPDCDVVLTGSRKVSRKHCCVAQIQNYFVVRDLGSMNGVRVNGARIKRESKLKAGDHLAIGDMDFQLELAEVKKRGPSSAKSVWVGNPQEGIRRAPAHLVSREVPVAIPEGEFDLIVDEEDEAETLPPSKPKSRPQPKAKKKSSRGKPPKRKHGQSDEVIVLGDDDIIN
jgi:pSer/pThr/pTyr-binding forkhead associated (FHA) protein